MTTATNQTRSFLDREVLSTTKTKAVGLGVLAILVTGSITGFTVISENSGADSSETVISDAKAVASQFQTWAATQEANTAVPANANSVAVTNGKAIEAVSTVETSNGVFWSISGTTDSYCIRAFHEGWDADYTAAKPYLLASPGATRESACSMQTGQGASDPDAPIDNTDISGATNAAYAKPKS